MVQYMRIISFCFLLMAVSYVQAAPNTDSLAINHKKRVKMEHEININTTFFIKQLVNFTGTSLAVSPYILGYKFFPVKHHGLRFGIGGNFSSQTQNPDSNFIQVNKSSELDYRIGYEYRHFFGKWWVCFVGVDMVNSFTASSSKVNSFTDIVTTSNNTWSLGGGPVVGIQANITKNISLFTETAFYYTYSSTLSKTQSLNFPQENINKLTNFGQSGKFILPTSLFFVFRFN